MRFHILTDVTTAEPPVRSIEVTKIFVKIPKRGNKVSKAHPEGPWCLVCWASVALSDNCDVLCVLELRTEDHEHNVRRRTISGSNYFQESMCVGRAALEFDCNCGEQNDLDGRAGRIPEGPGYTIIVGDSAALEQCSSPGPRRDNSRSHQARFDSASCCSEHFGGLQFIVVSAKR